jgi:hypothetical protein
MVKTVTSVSGGRTSSYMALNYPTDYNIFSLVRIEDPLCTPTDKKIIQYVEDKIQMPFIATAESDKTLYILQQLEQDLGKEIIWVTGPTFEEIIFGRGRKKPSLPNRSHRWCTQLMKLEPIFWYCFLNIMESEDDYVRMNIGYRFDEPRRETDDLFEYAYACNNFGQRRQKKNTLEWRSSEFPLRKNRINNFIVKAYFATKYQYMFPKYSNCVGCFNKQGPELQEQFDLEQCKMDWFKRMELQTGRRFNFYDTLQNIQTKDFTYGQLDMMEAFVSCNCTD